MHELSRFVVVDYNKRRTVNAYGVGIFINERY